MKSKEDNTQKKTKKLSSKELSWVLYDVGNSAYTLLACALIPIWYKSLAVGDGAGQISSDRATAYYAVAIAVMTVVSALIGPVCGAIADHMRIKKAIFSTTVVVGVSACILNGFTPTWVLFLVIYVLTKIFYNASLVFYDSMLVDVTTKDRMDEVSSYGYAWGISGLVCAVSCFTCSVHLWTGYAWIHIKPPIDDNRLCGYRNLVVCCYNSIV